MLRWPWKRAEAATEPEERASATDAVVSAILAGARGVAGSPVATAAVEIAAGAIGRALAAAKLADAPEGLDALLTPRLRLTAGRDLVRRGEVLLLILRDGGRLTALLPASSWTVEGSAPRESWRYRASLPGPSHHLDVTVAGSEVLHLTWATEAARPWAGISPLTGAKLTAEILAESETHLRDEAKAPRGYVLPQTEQGEDALGTLEDQLKALKGGLALVQSVRSQASTMGAAPAKDWEASRFGFNAPETLEVLRSATGKAVLAACGVPVEIVAPSDGTGQREAYRRFVALTLEPLGRTMASEIRAKLEAPSFALDFGPLMAADVTGKARAVQSLVGAGVPVSEALVIVGLLQDPA
ncbi:MAG: phage portal protein [Gemmatimonadetes bacterium]|nr:phage portal protein [Gemmatimonadota bacterium]